MENHLIFQMRYIFKLVFLFGTMENSRGPGSLNGQRYSFNSILEELLSAEQRELRGWMEVPKKMGIGFLQD